MLLIRRHTHARIEIERRVRWGWGRREKMERMRRKMRECKAWMKKRKGWATATTRMREQQQRGWENSNNEDEGTPTMIMERVLRRCFEWSITERVDDHCWGCDWGTRNERRGMRDERWKTRDQRWEMGWWVVRPITGKGRRFLCPKQIKKAFPENYSLLTPFY